MKVKRDDRGRFVSNNGNGKLGPEERWHIREMMANAATSRAQVIQKLLDPRRNMDDECGYPSTANINDATYQELYDREAIATRVVEVMPEESWLVQPAVFEDEDSDTVTKFEDAWNNLGSMLREESWFEDTNEGNPILELMYRADVLSGIGHYGVILLGMNDGESLSQPVEPSPSRQLLYLRAFPEAMADITQYESDETNPRFGLPTSYNITFSDPRNEQCGVGVPQTTTPVHWSRVLHIADNPGSSDVFGVPRMRPVLNRLLDLRKFYSGSAEMYWRGAFPGISIETHPQLGGDVEIDADAIRDEMESYMNGLQRYLSLMGASAKSLAPQVVDPSNGIEKQVEAICIQLGIPKRIFIGSERGELSSSQDAKTWQNRVRSRQNKYITPRIIVPFVNRLIQLGVMPVPAQFKVGWPDMQEQSPEEQAIIAERRTNSMAKYVGGGVDSLIEPLNYLTRILGYDQDVAVEILEATFEHVKDEAEAEPVQEETFDIEDESGG